MKSDKPTTVYVALLDEGTAVWRPVTAEHVGDDVYRLLGPIPETERWEFQPGDCVPCPERRMSDGSQLRVAIGHA